jgi:hypothetical protein
VLLLHRSACGGLPNNRDSHDGFIEVVVSMRYERALDSSSGRLSRVDCLEGAPQNGHWNP